MKNLYSENIISEEPFIWQMERRKWLKLALIGVIATQIPWLTSCVNSNEADIRTLQLDGKGMLNSSEMQFLFTLQNLLVPEDGNGPSAATVQAHTYFIWTLEDDRLPASEKKYFIEKLQDLKLLCQEKFKKQLTDLSAEDQNLFVKNNINEGWTRTYLSKMITIIFEAMLLDPIYGVNTNEVGWEWLNHNGGAPRPTLETKYPEIYLKTPLYG